MKNNIIQLRVSEDLHKYYKGNPDKHRKALELYKMAEEGLLKKYTEVKESE